MSTKAFLSITLPSILLYSINRNDPRWHEIPQWQKDAFWIIPTPGDGEMLRLPKPFGLGQIFGTGPERFLEFLDKQDPELFKESIKNALRDGTPGIIPQAVLPFIENWTNHNFFLNRPIVSRGMEDAPAEHQYSGMTSEAAKALGSWVNYSPAKLDNIFRAYTGGLGTEFLAALDKPLKATGITVNIPDPAMELSDIPFVKGFIVRGPYGSGSESMNKFYKKYEHFQGIEIGWRQLLDKGQQEQAVRYVNNNPEAALTFDWKTGKPKSLTATALRKVASLMSETRKTQREIYNSRRMSPDEKRALINRINRELTSLAAKALRDLPKP